MDRLLISIQLLLAGLSVVGVAAAAPELALEQVTRLLAAIFLTVVVARFKARAIVKLSPYVFVFLLALLAMVLLIGVSPTGSESRRWIWLGPISLQPSEFMKVAVIAYLATFFHNHIGNWEIWRPMLVIGVTAALIALEPDLSTAAFIFLLALAVMAAAGATLARIASISLAAVVVAALVAGPFLGQFSYWGERLIGFQDQWGAQELTDSSSYQAKMASRAATRGGLIGIGVGRPVNVPEDHTDFVSASIHQALGYLGIFTLTALYALLAWHGLRVARSVDGPAALLAAGATTYIVGQAGLNLLVSSGLAPVTGIPLPGVSYGLNSLLSVGIAFGFLHSASRQGRTVTLGVTAHGNEAGSTLEARPISNAHVNR